jgi:hypothetical protein
MNWDAVGSLAEVLGAVGVIASLLYLSQQIRQNTQATRQAMSHSIAGAVRDWNRPMLEDPELAHAFQVGLEDPAQLDEVARGRFMHLCFSFFRMFEDIHYQFRRGALDPEVWEAYAHHYGMYAKAPGMQAYWTLRCSSYQAAFRDFIDSYVPTDVVRIAEVVRRTGPAETRPSGAG